MPASKKNNKHRSFRLRWWQFVLLAIALGLSIWGVQAFFRHRNDQKQKVENLNFAKRELSALKSSYEAAGFVGEVQQTEDCYRNHVKYGDGWIYCDQKLLLTGKSENKSELLSTLRDIVHIFNLNPSFYNLSEPREDEFGSDDSVSMIRNIYPFRENGCNAQLTAYGENHGSAKNRLSFTLNIGCTQSHFDKFIYPERQ